MEHVSIDHKKAIHERCKVFFNTYKNPTTEELALDLLPLILIGAIISIMKYD